MNIPMRMPVVLLALAFLLSGIIVGADDTDMGNCRAWQQCKANAAKLKAMGPPPTRIVIMPTRYHELLTSEAGLEKTGIPGVELEDGQFTTTPDDLGLYLAVPWLALKLGVP